MGKGNASRPDKPKDAGGTALSTKYRTLLGCTVTIAVVAVVLAAVALFSGYTGGNNPSTADTSVPAVQQQEDGSQEEQEATCPHDWTITYETIHHDAVTHTETVEPVYENQTTYHTVCNECGEVIDGTAAQHIRDTGHSGYSTNVPITNEVLVSEGYTHEVTDTPAYDETVASEMVCTLCGATRPVTDTANAS